MESTATAMPTTQEIREKYLANQLFLIGEKIGEQYEVIDRRANYIVVVDGQGQDRKMFLDEAYTLHALTEAHEKVKPTKADVKAAYDTAIEAFHKHGGASKEYQDAAAEHSRLLDAHKTVPQHVMGAEEKNVLENVEKKRNFSSFSADLHENVFTYKGFRGINISKNPECENIFLNLSENCEDPWALLSAIRAVESFLEHRNTSTLERALQAVARIDDVANHPYLAEAKLTVHDMPFRVEDHPVKDVPNPGEVIRSLHKNYKCTPYEINNGQCDAFANDIIQHMGGSVWTSGLSSETGDFNNLPTHDFVEHKGKFYDAETPDGVDEWHQLPIFQKAMKEHTGLEAAIKKAKKLGPSHRKLNENKSVFTIQQRFDLLDEDCDFEIQETLTYSGFKTVLTEDFEREVNRHLSKLEKDTKLLDELTDNIRTIADIAHHYDSHSVHMKEDVEHAVAHAEKTKKITVRKLSSGMQLVKIAKRAAVELIAQKLAKKPIKKISKKEKNVILDAIKKKKGVVLKLAKKLIPKIKAIEQEHHEHEHEGARGTDSRGEFGSAGA